MTDIDKAALANTINVLMTDKQRQEMIDRAIINANPIQLYDKIRIFVNGKVIIDG